MERSKNSFLNECARANDALHPYTGDYTHHVFKANEQPKDMLNECRKAKESLMETAKEPRMHKVKRLLRSMR
ncbi:hypothetical protein [Methanosarcina sp. WH1]|uniref:hypothetical protein n=1 Tax=Methanosarcina sp. WH1 TaxID=1434102 RepID=UPI0006159FF0|nr:hypothetical protein [Methanosarcina sp. WH1]AKB22334.1 hypothetical protein MSWH1_2063 [Methanosarcina sp. WH1]